jgi:phosphoglycerol geranylgeranyltransferase
MTVLDYLISKSKGRPLHLTLLDPDKQPPEEGAEMAKAAAEGGTDGIMVGGSVGISQDSLDGTIKAVKEAVDLPVILFPGDISGISRYADAIFFMSLLNSRNPYYITGAQALGAPMVKRAGIETIPMGYLIVEPGGVVGYVGDAKLVPRNRVEVAAAYSLAAQYLGMRVVYLEAGSGAESHVPEEMVAAVKSLVDIPVIVGGGIRTKEDAAKVAGAGADVVVTGTVVEETEDIKDRVREIVEGLRRSQSALKE